MLWVWPIQKGEFYWKDQWHFSNWYFLTFLFCSLHEQLDMCVTVCVFNIFDCYYLFFDLTQRNLYRLDIQQDCQDCFDSLWRTSDFTFGQVYLMCLLSCWILLHLHANFWEYVQSCWLEHSSLFSINLVFDKSWYHVIFYHVILLSCYHAIPLDFCCLMRVWGNYFVFFSFIFRFQQRTIWKS